MSLQFLDMVDDIRYNKCRVLVSKIVWLLLFHEDVILRIFFMSS